MPRPTIIERARLYVARMPAAVAGQAGHNATFAVACALVKGFGLSCSDALPIMLEFNARCVPPWTQKDLEYKLRSADNGNGDRGYLLGDDAGEVGSHGEGANHGAAAAAPREKAKFDVSKLERLAGNLKVDLLWLANRSAVDPALVRSATFLQRLYATGEKVVVFTDEKSQGQAVWPDEELPNRGRDGVWFLCQPVDGRYHPNARVQDAQGNAKMSRRSLESVTAWRYMVIESDEAPLRLWLAGLAQLPLRIVAIYTSGGRSVHALVRVDAGTKAAWDDEKHAMIDGLVTLGADPGAMSAVRLTRLPGCYRESKGQMQKLLYLHPDADLRPLCDLLPRRDVENDWLRLAAAGPADADESGGAWITKGLEYYANVSERLAGALRAMADGRDQMAKEVA